MRAFILNGLDNQPELVKIYDMVVEELQKVAIIIDSVNLIEVEFECCKKCYHCWVKSPGDCVIEDQGKDIAQELIQADILVILTPTNGKEVSPLIKKAMERTIPNLAPALKNNTRMQNKETQSSKNKVYPTLIGIGVIEGNLTEPIDEQLFYKAIERIGIDFRSVKTASELVYTNEPLLQQQHLIEETFAIGVKY